MAILQVRQKQTGSFEEAFSRAQQLLKQRKGYLGHELHKGIEYPDRYLLIIRWETLEDHTEGFRGSPQYQQWKAMLHHFYEPFPEVVHFNKIY